MIKEDDRDGGECYYGDDDEKSVGVQRSSEEKARGVDVKPWLSVFLARAKSSSLRSESVGAAEEFSAEGAEVGGREWSAGD